MSGGGYVCADVLGYILRFIDGNHLRFANFLRFDGFDCDGLR